MLKKNDDNERKLYINKLAKDRADLHGGKVNCHLKQINHTEAQRKTNRRIKHVLKPHKKQGVVHVLIPARSEYDRHELSFDHHDVDEMWKRIYPKNGKDIKEWETITDMHEMERIMVSWQRKHFMQANETPLASMEWRDKICFEWDISTTYYLTT